MSKRLQVVLDEEEYEAIQRIAPATTYDSFGVGARVSAADTACGTNG
jgi:hypothetical protein